MNIDDTLRCQGGQNTQQFLCQSILLRLAIRGCETAIEVFVVRQHAIDKSRCLLRRVDAGNEIVNIYSRFYTVF